jgi:secreted trypsin-like serine protease
VKQRLKYEKYNTDTHSNDMALLQIECTPPLDLTTTLIRTLPLARNDLNVANVNTKAVYATGFGLLASGGTEPSDSLKEVTLTIVDRDTCAKKTGFSIDDTMICAYGEGKDTCQGDSGGPLVMYDETTSKYILVGLTSFGKGCGEPGMPGVYAYVPAFVDWVCQKVPAACVDTAKGQRRAILDFTLSLYSSMQVCYGCGQPVSIVQLGQEEVSPHTSVFQGGRCCLRNT